MIRTPVTIITGYLGAGKTTLLQRVLESAGGRVAVLMNEFGDIAVDCRVVQGTHVKMVELSGGCVCCSLSGEFEAAVHEILDTVKPEWIVVETTGVAEPGSLAHDIGENIPEVRLDAIVTVVDADSMARFPSLGDTGRQQIELADVLILNKKDLVSTERMVEIREALKGINVRAVIIEAERCGFDTNLLSGVQRKDGVFQKHRKHVPEWDYFEFVSDEKLDHGRFLEWLKSMPTSVYRSKGFVVTDKGSFLMNYVAGRHTLEEFRAERTELVFIGRWADERRDEVLSGLRRCARGG